jgi:hypothetical protein
LARRTTVRFETGEVREEEERGMEEGRGRREERPLI